MKRKSRMLWFDGAGLFLQGTRESHSTWRGIADHGDYLNSKQVDWLCNVLKTLAEKEDRRLPEEYLK